MSNVLILIVSSVLFQTTTDFEMKSNLTARGHDYMDIILPSGIKLKTLKGEAYELQVDSATLIQVWSVCCGGDAMDWAEQRYEEQVFGEKGLRVVSINFENGADPKQQVDAVNGFLQKMPKPAELYLDSLGYAIDSLPVKGFPTYILVNKEGKIIFRTSGKSQEGIALLNSEIQNLLQTND